MKTAFKKAYSAIRAHYSAVMAGSAQTVTPTSADWFFGQRDTAIRDANRVADRVFGMRHKYGYTAADRAFTRADAIAGARAGDEYWRYRFRALVREAGHYWLAA